MKLFAWVSPMLVMSFTAIVAQATSNYHWNWGDYYSRMNHIENGLRRPHKVCFVELMWAVIFGQSRPKCITVPWYHPEQSDDENKWCVETNGETIQHTLDKIQTFPYNCEKTRECPMGLVREKTKRCEATCAEAGSQRFRTKFHCKNKCICPRGKYRDENGDCVWLKECKQSSCEAPKVYTECAPKCPFTCATRRHICDYACDEVVHCVCPPHMVLMSKNNNTCIDPEDCPKCEGDALPTDCAPTCPTTCSNDDSCEEGSEKCEKGVFCICPPGMVRLDRNLPVRCVLPLECPGKCEAPMISKRCTTPCQPTCDNLKPICEEECKDIFICSCPEGYVQKSKTDKTCIKYEECMTERLGCMHPAKAVKCTSICAPSCEPTRFMCLRKCESEYVCGCPEGYLIKTQNGVECLKKEDCPDRCIAPKVFKSCSSPCPPTCQDPNPGSCRRGCNPEVCVCPEGMLQPDKDTLTCIMPSECPVTCKAPKVVKDCETPCPATCDDPEPSCGGECVPKKVCGCPLGMVQKSKDDPTCVELSECVGCQAPAFPVLCTSDCPETCEKPRFRFNIPCKRECPSKFVCGCPEGYILKVQNGKECMPKDDCPSSCKPPLEFASCASMCRPTCENPEPRACRRGCSSQLCVCPKGMLQPDEDTISCILPSECPKCASPKVYQECPSKCQATCANPDPQLTSCEAGCREDKCVCPTGMLLLSEDTNVCVEPLRCPKICTFPEVSTSCLTTCELRCDNLLTWNTADCGVKCDKELCECAEGFVRKSITDRTCVDISTCPIPVAPIVTNVVCEAPKIYDECPSRCPRTCADPNPKSCLRGCDTTVSCVCPTGFVQRDVKNRTCIRVDDCPVCEEPKIYVECASKCRPTCQTPNPAFCDDSCVADLHCVCPPGMVHPKNGDYSCVSLSQCPETCDFPTVATDCAPKCPATCDNPVPECDPGCDPDVKCICPNGLLQLNATEKRCVFPNQCPGLSDCPSIKVPTRCASSCPPTCDDPMPICITSCRPDVNCECPGGMLQRSATNDTCVWPSDCDN